MERSFIVRPLEAPWITYEDRCMVTLKQDTIDKLGWKPGQAVEITIEDDKIVIKKLDNFKQ